MAEGAVTAVKVPTFIPSDPILWFSILESTFESSTPKPITVSKTKFNYCVAHLPPETAVLVRDVILKPDQTDPYEKLKQEVISRCGESKSEEIRKLLTGEQLGNQKPSELLRIMQRRAESYSIQDELLLELFLQQLPGNVQSILASVTPLTIKKAAEIADRIMEFSGGSVNATSAEPECMSSSTSSQSQLLAELKELRKEVAILRRSRSSSRSRRSASRPRNRSPVDSVCWYHRTFKNRANKCIPPCSYQENFNRQA